MSLTGLRFRTPDHEAGIALVLVLWMLVLLTVIANGLVFSSRSEILIAGNLASLARAEALADAAVYKAILALQSATPGLPAANQTTVQVDPARWRADGLTRTWRYREGELLVTIFDETGKIDINTAPPPLLHGFFRSAGVEEEQAIALVDAILDWRDSDRLRRPHGAENDEYAAAGLLYGPANSDFESIDELRQVLGMSESLFNRIASFITVFSYQGGINSNLAPRQVLLAIPGVTADQVDQFIAQRTGLLEQGLPPLPFAPAQSFSATSSSATYSIDVEVDLGDNIRFKRLAVIRLTGDPKEPYSIMDWRAPISISRESENPGIESNASLK